ncbi:DUF7322 domain-containing protein [Salinigranum sp. GCM10025319]|uniref:DUF7322 domain-containing protein n=1 Tax=Salinigranum sp. GCM10025319 TaxID=3252687 RepID=UPI00360DC8DC
MDDDWFDDSENLYPEGMEGPTVRTPSVDVPTASEDVFQRSAIARLFVLHVFVWNAVILFLSLGVMLIYFRNDWETGRRLLAAGVILAAYGIYRWPRDGDEPASPGDDGSNAGSAGDDSTADGSADASVTVDSAEARADDATIEH